MKLSMMLVLLLGLTGCSGSQAPETANAPEAAKTAEETKPEAPAEVGYDEKEMDAATARAKSEVDLFIAELANPTGMDHAVKAPILDGEELEHLWLIDVKFENGEFKGKIADQPEFVKNVKAGQEWTVKQEDISDWTFLREGKIHGNYTTRALMSTMPADEAAQFRSTLANP